MAKPLSIDELLRIACIYAERDQQELVAAYKGMEDEEIVIETKAFLAQLRAYRLKRWGKTRLEDAIAKAESVPINQIRKRFGNG